MRGSVFVTNQSRDSVNRPTDVKPHTRQRWNSYTQSFFVLVSSSCCWWSLVWLSKSSRFLSFTLCTTQDNKWEKILMSPKSLLGIIARWRVGWPPHHAQMSRRATLGPGSRTCRCFAMFWSGVWLQRSNRAPEPSIAFHMCVRTVCPITVKPYVLFPHV